MPAKAEKLTVYANRIKKENVRHTIKLMIKEDHLTDFTIRDMITYILELEYDVARIHREG